MAKREWDKTLFQRYEHVASPSQLVDYLDCPRKWWFRRCLRLPEVKDQHKFTFGNVLHGVVERWLKADDSGRGEDGNPVELYPEGWAETLSPVDQALVRKLFDLAVKEGVIRRLPGRQIELPYEREVVSGICSIGALDITSPEGVEDQKSTKSPRYIATQKELASDPKMLSYAYEWLSKAWADFEGTNPADAPALSWDEVFPQVKLRLNYFVKDPEAPAVKAVETFVKTADVLDWWETTAIPAHRGMLELKRAKIDERDWRKVTGPQTKDTCKKYGGCPRAKICAGIQSCAAHRAEIERINLKSQPKPKTKSPKPVSNIFNRKKPVTAAAAEAAIPAVPPPAPKVEAPPSAANPTTNAPWAYEGCFACKGKGINSQGNPCKACETIRKRRGEPTVNDFEVWHDTAGNLCWKAKDASAPAAPKTEPAPAPEAAPEPEGKAPIVAEPKVKRQKAAKQSKPETAPAPAPTVETAPAPQEAQETGQGFRLFINAMPTSSSAMVDGASVLHLEGAEMAREFGAPSFYEMDAFKRRDLLASAAGEIAKDLEGKDLVAIGGGQDLKALVEALRPLAREVVQGVF